MKLFKLIKYKIVVFDEVHILFHFNNFYRICHNPLQCSVCAPKYAQEEMKCNVACYKYTAHEIGFEESGPFLRTDYNKLQLKGKIVRSALSLNLSICGAKISPDSFKIIGRLFGYNNKIKIVQFCKNLTDMNPILAYSVLQSYNVLFISTTIQY